MRWRIKRSMILRFCVPVNVNKYMTFESKIMQSQTMCMLKHFCLLDPQFPDPRDLLNSLGKSDINSILKRTGLFNESNTSLSLCNPCVYKVISTYYTYNSKLLYYQIKEFSDAFNAFKLAPIEQIRVKFFQDQMILFSLQTKILLCLKINQSITMCWKQEP